MSNRDHTWDRTLVALAALSAAWLVFNMIALMLDRDEIFLKRDTLSSVEVAMIAGFFLILMFDITSITWLFLRRRRSTNRQKGSAATPLLGVLCLALLFADKIMVDEIGRESLLGWETLGEWLILYCMLTVQLAYHLIFILQLLRSRRR